jgi:general secretion pathway protein D
MGLMHNTGRLLLVLVIAIASGCATTGQPPANQGSDKRAQTSSAPTGKPSAVQPAEGRGVIEEEAGFDREGSGLDPPTAELFKGTGEFIDTKAARRPAYGFTRNGDVTLNFQGSDIQEVVKSILGDILKVNYAIDEKVKGQVFLQTSAPLARNTLIPVLEALLRMKGAVLVKSADLYKVVPEGDALSSAVSPDVRIFRDRGFQILVIPLSYIAASEMQKILEPIKPSNGVVQVDNKRNLLIVAGTQVELAHLLKTVKIFDVDQLKGMSVGLYPLNATDPKTMIEELEELIGASESDGLGGMLRFMPIERLNSVLAISPQAEYLEQVQTWIERLDRAVDGNALNLYVYHVQHGRADHLADVLSQLLGDGGNRDEQPLTPQPSLAPGAVPAVIESPITMSSAGAQQALGAIGTAGANKGGVPVRGSAGTSNKYEGAAADRAQKSPSKRRRGRDFPRLTGGDLDVGRVTIIADDHANALLIKASAADYTKIERVLRRLDVLPLQVLVETSIVDVALTGDFSFGLEWFFKSRKGDKQARAQLDLGGGGIGPIVPGFSYTIVDSADVVRAVLNTLASDGKANILSSPSLMVLDNRTATIRVGDQVPIRTSTGSSISSSGVETIIASSISMVDTGVMLEVTPRVNKSGVVMMDITQEVNTVAQTTSSGIDSPTINQRSITTTVSVHSGETIVLGGLIIDRRTKSKSGVPGLRNIPGLGWLFGARSEQAERSELLVLITPTAVRDQSEARAVTAEYRKKMKDIFEFKDKVDNRELPKLLQQRGIRP